jgi:hypothetical protein
MKDELLFERLASHDGPAAPDGAFDDRLYSILEREVRGRRSLRPVLLLAATLALVLTVTVAVAVGSGLIQPPWVNPSLVPTPTPFSGLLPCTEPSATPEASTSPEAFTWSPERAAEDWPGAVRAEPTGCVPVVVDARMGETSGGLATRLYSDRTGDASPMALPWIDIVELEFTDADCYSGVCVSFDLAGEAPEPIPSPRDEWIAYGIVVDTTGDGQPDVRYGIDNAPGGDSTRIIDVLRIWSADPATGETHRFPCCQTRAMDVFWPGELRPTRGFMTVPGVWRRADVFHFYVWASVIHDGEVVSTDYAPDFGWLDWP